MEDDLKKNKKWKTTSILRQSYRDYLTTKTSKTNGFDTIEIDLVILKITIMYPIFWNHIVIFMEPKNTNQFSRNVFKLTPEFR